MVKFLQLRLSSVLWTVVQHWRPLLFLVVLRLLIHANADVVVCIFAYLHTVFHTEYVIRCEYWFQATKELHGEIFSSLGVIFKEKLSLKNCRISGCQKRLWAHTFFVIFWVLNPCCTKIIQYIRLILAELIVLWPFNIQNWFICSSIRNWIAYANEASSVNKDSPITALDGLSCIKTKLWLKPAVFLNFRSSDRRFVSLLYEVFNEFVTERQKIRKFYEEPKINLINFLRAVSVAS